MYANLINCNLQKADQRCANGFGWVAELPVFSISKRIQRNQNHSLIMNKISMGWLNQKKGYAKQCFKWHKKNTDVRNVHIFSTLKRDNGFLYLGSQYSWNSVTMQCLFNNGTATPVAKAVTILTADGIYQDPPRLWLNCEPIFVRSQNWQDR